MRPLSSGELLDVWERGKTLSPQRRALLLIAASDPDTRGDDLYTLPVGERDRRLIRLREWAFGSDVPALVTCPRCSLQLEFNFVAGAMCTSSETARGPVRVHLPAEGLDVRLRPVTCGDLVEIERCQTDEEASRLIIERCTLEVTREGDAVSTTELPESALTLIDERLSLADPDADLRLSIVCSDCDFAWSESFDIVSLLWEEIHVWAIRLLHEVHGLASAYGWFEADILALSPLRRRAYLELAGR